MIPIAIAALATLFGSWITEYLKKWLTAPPLAINWAVGVLLFVAISQTPWYQFDIEHAALMTVTVLGWNAVYKGNLLSLRDSVRRTVRK